MDFSEPYFEDGKWWVDEQLYPESRGFKVHEFDTEQAAKEFIESRKG